MNDDVSVASALLSYQNPSSRLALWLIVVLSILLLTVEGVPVHLFRLCLRHLALVLAFPMFEFHCGPECSRLSTGATKHI